jgi:hypothetical protein
MKPLRVHLASLQVTDGYAFARVEVSSRTSVRNVPAVRGVLDVVLKVNRKETPEEIRERARGVALDYLDPT